MKKLGTQRVNAGAKATSSRNTTITASSVKSGLDMWLIVVSPTLQATKVQTPTGGVERPMAKLMTTIHPK